MKAIILIIEDDTAIRNNLELLFSSLDYDVIAVATAEEALEKLQTDIPDLIICDINLPQMNGFELKEKINTNPKLFQIPFIFLTARDTYQDLRYGMNLAADDYIYKPYTANEIIKSVELRLLKGKELKKNKEEKFIFLKINNSVKKIFFENIIAIIAENQYSRLILKNNDYIFRRALNEWEKLLPRTQFKRASRSALVNFNKITEIVKNKEGSFLKLEDFDELIKITKTENFSAIMS